MEKLATTETVTNLDDLATNNEQSQQIDGLRKLLDPLSVIVTG